MGIFQNIKNRVSDEMDEREADRQSDRLARSAARKEARDVREEEFKKTAIAKERLRGERERKSAREGGFIGQLGKAATNLAKAGSRPVRSSQVRTTRMSKGKKGKKGKRARTQARRTEPQRRSSLGDLF